MTKDRKPGNQNVNYQVSLKILLKNRNGKFLLLEMPDNSSMAGYYDLIGGRIKEREKLDSFKKIIEREMREEVGSEVKYRLKETPVAVGRHSYFSKILGKEQLLFWILFEARYIKGKIKISPEHKEYKWKDLNKNNLKNYFVRGPLEIMRNYFCKKFM